MVEKKFQRMFQILFFSLKMEILDQEKKRILLGLLDENAGITTHL